MDLAEFEQTLNECETRLDRLRALYEQYFQGIERLEPTVPRKELDRAIDRMRRAIPRNTALRFRYQTLLQKYTSYQTYWRRISRQIEEGTFRRDIRRARNRVAANRNARDAMREGYEIDIDTELEDTAASADGDDEILAALKMLEPVLTVPPQPGKTSLSPFALPGARKEGTSPRPISTFGLPSMSKAPPKPATAKPPASPPPSAPRSALTSSTDTSSEGPGSKTFGRPRSVAPAAPAAPARSDDDARFAQVYESYVEARRRNNERVDNVKFETVKKSIEQMLPRLREKHAGKKIDFEVVIKDGKVGIKPVPK